jgi:hypothetical protein
VLRRRPRRDGASAKRATNCRPVPCSTSKTEAGTGRAVPFTRDVCSTLTLWLSRFPGADESSFVFPRHAIEMLEGGREARMVRPVLNKPMDSWRRAWGTALRTAGVSYRGTISGTHSLHAWPRIPQWLRAPFERWQDMSANKCSNGTAIFVARLNATRLRLCIQPASSLPSRGHRSGHNRAIAGRRCLA